MDLNASACLFFSHCYGIGPHLFQKLLAVFESPHEAYCGSVKKLDTVLSDALVRIMSEKRASFNLEKVQQELHRKHIGYIAFSDKNYPDQLRHIPDPPIGLFYRGDWKAVSWDKNGLFGIVGTRKPSFYGKTSAHSFAHSLAVKGQTIVSGMALGVDTCAHIGALEADGTTIAVLGCGVDIVYPKENKKLYDRIIEKKGIVMSEFVPGQVVLPGLFVARNRIISGLSWGALVVEGAQNSGSLITARYAAEQGRELFALPGQIGAVESYAPLLLIKEGARMALSPSDILEGAPVSSGRNIPANLPELQQRIVNILKSGPLATDELIAQLQTEVAILSSELVMLELLGIIEKIGDGRWTFKTTL